MTFALLLGILTVRYFLTAGLPAWALRRWSGHPWLRARRLDAREPDPRVVRGEIFWSLLSGVVFAAFGTLLVWLWREGRTRVYLDASEYGLWYLPVSFVIYAFAHDTYFYWTHRWMHHPMLFRLMHAVHHRSRNPTAWASFSFHWSEAIVQAAILPLLVLWIPIHWTVLFCFLGFMTALGVINHLGYELYPRGFATGRWSCWGISATHHQMHHQRVTLNYGLYFTLWDRWLGTHHPDYERIYGAKVDSGS